MLGQRLSKIHHFLRFIFAFVSFSRHPDDTRRPGADPRETAGKRPERLNPGGFSLTRCGDYA
jgi:hypothetical protein